LRFKILVSILCLMLTIETIAQTIDVKVVVKNDKGELVSNATAQVLSTVDSAILFVKTIKNNTSFSLNKNSAYLLRVTAIGVSIVYKNIQTTDKDTVINIIAQTALKNLDAVTVTSRKPLIKQEDDKTIVDAEVLANSSTNAYEVLEKTPGTIVDQDGNVYLNSATPATIYINGREVKLSAADLTSLLKSLPAGSVSKIEILRNPSAKFDAASSGGIVNIVLKKGVKLGTNGSIDASHFQGIYATETIGFNVNKSENKLNTYFSYNYTNRTNFNVLTSSRTNTDTLFTQYAFTKFPTTTQIKSGTLVMM
jgi:iron complex outermembrane recepter protein